MRNPQANRRCSTRTLDDEDRKCRPGSPAWANRAIGLLSVVVALLACPLETKADSIYAIRGDGQMLFYRYAGMNDGSNSWAVEQKVIGTGWQSLSRVLGGHNGAIYAIRPDGGMLYYRFAGMADGSMTWAVEQKVIGTGWQGLSHVFAGDNGAIYAIRPDGQMVFYRFAGLADGANRWAVEQKVIGTGWMFTHVIAGNSGNLALTPQTPPKPAPAPAPAPIVRNNPACATYARSAVTDFKLGMTRPECVKRVKSEPGRWNDDFNHHYDWCMTVQPAARTSESSIRDKLLLDCGARFTF